MTHKNLARSLVALALVALVSAGCSNGSAGGGNDNATDRDTAVKFSECMRKNGVPDFPDPNAAGDFDFGVNVSGEVWTKAIGACKDLQPPGTLEVHRSAEQQAAALKFAQCIRDNGVKDFPDPANGEPVINTNLIPSVAGSNDLSVLNAAIEKCRDDKPRATGSKG